MPDVKQIIRDAVSTAAESYDVQYGVTRKLDKYSKQKRQKMRLAKNKLNSVRDVLTSFVLNSIDTVDWADKASVDRFCAAFDDRLEKCQVHFLEGCDKLDKADPNERLKDFKSWLAGTRNFVRRSIENVIEANREAALEKSEPENSAVAKTPIVESGTATETANPGVSSGLPPEAGEVSSTKESAEESLLNTDADSHDETEEVASEESEGEKEPEGESSVGDKSDALGGEASADSEPVSSDPDEIIEKSLLPTNLKKILMDLVAAISLGDPSLIEEMSGKLVIGLEDQATITEEALRVHQKTLEEARQKIREQAAEIEQKAAETVALQAEHAEAMECSMQENRDLQEMVVYRDEELKKAREEAARAQSKAEGERGETGDETFGESVPINSEQVQSQLEEAINKIREASDLIKNQQSAARISKSPAESVKPDYKKDLAALESQIEFLESQIADLHDISAGQAEWIAETREKADEEFKKLRVFAETEADYKKIDEKEKNVEAQINEVSEAQKRIEARIAELESERNVLATHREAILTVLGGLPQFVDAGADEGISLTEYSVDLPPWDIIFSSSADADKAPDTLRSTETEEIAQGHSEAGPFDIPYDLDVSDVQLLLVRELESFLSDLTGKTEDEIKAAIPFELEQKYNDYYEELVKELRDGSFVPTLKMAFTILCALRKDGEFAPRLSKTVGLAMKIKGVQLVKMLGEETKRVSRIFMKMCIIGKTLPDIETIHRVSVGSRWGQANQLTPTGRLAAKVWTADLLKSKKITAAQLTAMNKWIAGHDQAKREEDAKDKDAKKED